MRADITIHIKVIAAVVQFTNAAAYGIQSTYSTVTADLRCGSAIIITKLTDMIFNKSADISGFKSFLDLRGIFIITRDRIVFLFFILSPHIRTDIQYCLYAV